MGVVGRALAVVLAVVLIVGTSAAFLYATDYPVEATITDKGQDGGGHYVIATTKILGYDTKQYVPFTQWVLIHSGYFVVYHVRSGDIIVYTSEGGRQIYPPA